jgi:hypothetical protein
MNTIHFAALNSNLPADLLADMEAAVAAAAGKPIDPQVARRIRERAVQATEEVRRRHGVLNIAVDLIRETRDE